MERHLRKIWLCNDVWLDIFPLFDHAQLGLKMALISFRFNALVDKYFNGKFTSWGPVGIRKDIGLPKLFIVGKSMGLPLPKHPLPNKFCFERLEIEHIDHFVIAFLRSNKQIFDRGTNLYLYLPLSYKIDVQPIWNVFVRRIWPLFATNIRHLSFSDGVQLSILLRLTSPTILTDLNIYSVDSGHLFPDLIGDDGPNATAAQMLSKWLHTPTKDGQPKQLCCRSHNASRTNEWINIFKEAFLRATTSPSSSPSASYKIQFILRVSMPIVPFELVNRRTKERLTLQKEPWGFIFNHWLLKRCPIWGRAAAQRKSENSNTLNNVHFRLTGGSNCIGLASSHGTNGGAGTFLSNAILAIFRGKIGINLLKSN